MADKNLLESDQIQNIKNGREDAADDENLLVGSKRKAENQESFSNAELLEECLRDSVDDVEGDDEDEENDGDVITKSKLFKIEKLIEEKKLSKRERRLLQNRKSALKCRLKKQSELEGMKSVVEQLNEDNCKLKEKVSPTAFFAQKNNQSYRQLKTYSLLVRFYYNNYVFIVSLTLFRVPFVIGQRDERTPNVQIGGKYQLEQKI